jgi:probable HAF family extracellular repeat protein
VIVTRAIHELGGDPDAATCLAHTALEHVADLDFASVALGISDKGVVVGEAEIDGGGRHGFQWTAANGMIDLGETSRAAESVNGRGQIVGFGPPGEEARMWRVK